MSDDTVLRTEIVSRLERGRWTTTVHTGGVLVARAEDSYLTGSFRAACEAAGLYNVLDARRK